VRTTASVSRPSWRINYFFLALFPAVLFVLALASFFPLTNFIDDVVPVFPPDLLGFLSRPFPACAPSRE
jgi:hypothetical protein